MCNAENVTNSKYIRTYFSSMVNATESALDGAYQPSSIVEGYVY